MFKSILVPIDLADTDLAKPAIATAATLSQTWSGSVRLLNVLPMTPVMLAEYVPADFDVQQRADEVRVDRRLQQPDIDEADRAQDRAALAERDAGKDAGHAAHEHPRREIHGAIVARME